MDTNIFPRVVGLCGPKFSGKGTAARLLIAAGYIQVSFARPLKDMLVTMGLTEQDIGDPARKETPHPLLGGKSPRWAMQSLGTEWGRRMIYDDIWVGIARHRIQMALTMAPGVVVDDCRFNNEAVMLWQLGAALVEITRPGLGYHAGHASEAGIGREFILATVVNDGLPEDLHQRLAAALRTLPAAAPWPAALASETNVCLKPAA